MQKYRHVWTQKCRNSEMCKCRDAEIQKCRNAEMQRCINAFCVKGSMVYWIFWERVCVCMSNVLCIWNFDSKPLSKQWVWGIYIYIYINIYSTYIIWYIYIYISYIFIYAPAWLGTPQEDLPLSLRMADQSAVQLPWEIRQLRMRMRDPRCELCQEGKGLLCHVVRSGEYVLRCLHCFTCMLTDDTHTVLIDGFRRGVHSYTVCSCGSSVGNIDNLS